MTVVMAAAGHGCFYWTFKGQTSGVSERPPEAAHHKQSYAVSGVRCRAPVEDEKFMDDPWMLYG